MAINFANETFVKIKCDQITNDYHGVENLISNNPESLQNGFQVEYFCRPPVTIQIDSIKYSFDLMYLEIGLRLRMHKTNSIELYIRRSNFNEYRFIDRYNCDNNKNILTISNRNYRPNIFLPEHRKIFTNNVERINGRNMRSCYNIGSIKIRIISCERSSVPCLSFLKIYGKPSRLTNENMKEFLSLIPVEKNSSLNGQQSQQKKQLTRSELEKLAPLEFFDSITNELMCQPYLLPKSNKNIDKLTLDRYLDGKSITECKDPFTNVLFTNENKPVINVELKSRIDLFFQTNGQSEIERRENLRKKLLDC